MLDQMLSWGPSAPGYLKALSFLQNRYNSITALNTAWYGTPFSPPAL